MTFGIYQQALFVCEELPLAARERFVTNLRALARHIFGDRSSPAGAQLAASALTDEFLELGARCPATTPGTDERGQR